MTGIIVTTRESESRTLELEPEATLMQLICDAGVDELLALCGGVCSCGTCHVYVDAEFLPLLPPVEEDEDLILQESPARQPNSRLSCQIRLTEALQGLRVTIAPEG
ncbi:2Fe-2S iron-sulfur cluster-binding protein [Pseudomaricurvus sp. HS19]|uniref:2Fe-2S iron-sulfur cluster-binding protein n=1 Tax=Pseudomaricurvus sp. HS19 TaxID=2692626 RepID=UPI00136EBFA6|nr:2Fe-2S iron-sulfur cluster-binding protein [Pseudomaricurvus sp. HS19]MYM61965.1 2Fe-2S iron-sulfur cluster binding domain-containing protein [Pseudomaricurvus sp. HS19]